MTSNLIPMLSSSPPPMDENGSFDDDEDDFGDFTCAGGVKVLDSPLNSPVKGSAPPLRTPDDNSESSQNTPTWNKHRDPGEDDPIDKPSCRSSEDTDVSKDVNGTFSEKIVVFSEDVEEFNCDEDEMDFGEEKPGLSAKYAFTHSELHDNTSQESVTDSGLCSSSQRSETSPLPPGEAVFPELSPETEPEETQERFPDDAQLFYLKTDLELSHRSEDQFVADSFDDTTTPVNEPQSFDDSLQVSQALDDDDDDFQDFATCSAAVAAAAPSSNFQVQSVTQSSERECAGEEQREARTGLCGSGDADDFADFACAQFSTAEGTASEEACADSFADFSQVSFASSSDAEDSGWANFTAGNAETPLVTSGTSSPSLQMKSQLSTPRPAEVRQLLGSAFPGTCEDVEDSELTPLSLQPILGTESSNSCMLWRRLEDLDRSVSLQYQWGGSHSFQRTLQALNIDSRNVPVKKSRFRRVELD